MGMNDRHTVQGIPNIGFQPTPPYGDEQKAMQQIVDRENYNPHPRMGMNTQNVSRSGILLELLQPTPRMGMNVIPPTERKP